MDSLAALHAIAASQHGVLHADQVRSAGITGKRLRHAIGARRLERVTRRVLRVPGSPRTVHQRVMIAVVDAAPGAFGADATALALWGLPGFDLRTLQLDRPRGISRRPGELAVVHEVLDLLPHHVTVLDGVPIVRPERAIFEVAGWAHPKRVERAIDNAWSRRLVSGRSLRALHAELAEHGRAGSASLGELLDARPDDDIPPASNVEARFAAILDRAGEPPMRRQVDSGGDRWIGRVDFRDELLPVIVEAQSERHHSALVDQHEDAKRVTALEAAGFIVVTVTDTQVWHHPDEVVALVRAARQAARARRAA